VRVLLDEDLDVRLRHHLGEGVEAVTVEHQGWKGLKNGELLRRAAEEFDVLLTMDEQLPSQQSLRQFDVAVVILRAKSKALTDLVELMPEVRARLAEFGRGQATRILPPEEPTD
jgi:predicted nuclease of predicted toxin-antitoxin system